MKNIYLSITLVLHTLNSYSQHVTIQSGPMLGYATMDEAVVWVQLSSAAQVYAVYDDLVSDEFEEYQTQTVSTSPNTGNTAKLYFTNLKAGHSYSYSIYVNGELQGFSYPLQFKAASKTSRESGPDDFTMAMGSCFYINDEESESSYGGDYSIVNEITKKSPDAMLWLGDNIYLRDADWWTRTGYLKRYNQMRGLPELQELLASCSHFATWDDHDFGPNDANGSWINKDLALEMFKLYWVNHSYGYKDLPGIMSAFSYSDIDFIIMDNRYHRTEKHVEGRPEHIFGQTQSDRLIDLLAASRSPFKVVVTGGQFLNTAKVYENHANYEDERQYILDRIEEENIKGVIFISGDRHHSEISELTLENGTKVYEFTISPLTSRPNSNVTELNDNRVEHSLIQERNFGIMKVSGNYRERKINFSFYNSKGEVLHTYEIDSGNSYK